MEEELCPICLGELGSSTTQLPCKHNFCTKCILWWFKKSESCPMDRRKFTKQEIKQIQYNFKILKINGHTGLGRNIKYNCQIEGEEEPRLLKKDEITSEWNKEVLKKYAKELRAKNSRNYRAKAKENNP